MLTDFELNRFTSKSLSPLYKALAQAEEQSGDTIHALQVEAAATENRRLKAVLREAIDALTVSENQLRTLRHEVGAALIHTKYPL